VGPADDGVGVATEEGDGVGATVGCGVLARGAGLVGVTRGVGLGVGVGRGVVGTAVGEVVGCARVGEPVAAVSFGLTSR